MNHGGVLRGRGPQLIVAFVAAVAVVAGLVVWQRPWEGGAPVAMVGDSIFSQASPVFADRLGDDWELRIEAVSGHTTAQQLDAGLRLADQEPPAEQLVIGLGTNDINQEVPLEESRAALEQLIAGHPGARCVHLVTITDRGVADDGAIQVWGPAVEVNEMFGELAAADPRIGVVDWAAELHRHDAEPSPAGPLLADPVHPSAHGQEVLAGLIGDALDRCTGDSRPPSRPS